MLGAVCLLKHHLKALWGLNSHITDEEMNQGRHFDLTIGTFLAGVILMYDAFENSQGNIPKKLQSI
jgi:hypothetical protein